MSRMPAPIDQRNQVMKTQCTATTFLLENARHPCEPAYGKEKGDWHSAVMQALSAVG